MQLPRAITSDLLINSSYSFKPVTGLLELSLNEKAVYASNHPEYVSLVLAEALETIAGESVDIEKVKSLCVGDRQFLMQKLAAYIDDSPVWLTARCNECSELFDFSIRYSELPVKPAGKNFPEVILDTHQGQIKVRVPNGRDQEMIADISDDEQALQKLLGNLIKPLSEAGASFEYTAEAIEDIEKAVEDMSPEIATEVRAECPECQTQSKIALNTERGFGSQLNDLYKEIHELAMHYHWSEQEILSLSRKRRLTYLGLIDQSREMFSVPAEVK